MLRPYLAFGILQVSRENLAHGNVVVLPVFWYKKCVCVECLRARSLFQCLLVVCLISFPSPGRGYYHPDRGQPVGVGGWGLEGWMDGWMDRLMRSFLLLARMGSPVTS